MPGWAHLCFIVGSHTNIMRYIEIYTYTLVGLNFAFQTAEKLYFVLDYCAGGELFFHLGHVQRFPEARARFYAAEITLAIEYVHNLDIIYRDLKPENVLLDANGHIRLTDFGLSKEGTRTIMFFFDCIPCLLGHV
jgi:serum/glucocorticoid-regulated kinase 2